MMTFEKWVEEMSREIFLPNEEEKKAINKYFEMFDEELNEEESCGLRPKEQ